MYRVVTDYNTYVWMKEEDIENSIKDDFLLKREIIMAMGMTHNKKYLKYLYPYLNNEVFYKRREAAQSIFLIDGEEGLENLKKRESQLDDIEYNDPPSGSLQVIYFKKLKPLIFKGFTVILRIT